jgi:hypothetical protein
MDSEKEIGFYRGYALYCDNDGDFSAKKTSEAREYQDYSDLDELKEDIEKRVTHDSDTWAWSVILIIFFFIGCFLGMFFTQYPMKVSESAVSSLNSSLNKCLEQKQEPLTFSRGKANCLFESEVDTFSVTLIDDCMLNCDRQYGPTAVMLCQQGCKKK